MLLQHLTRLKWKVRSLAQAISSYLSPFSTMTSRRVILFQGTTALCMKKDERMKSLRQDKIREIVENYIVETQEDLAERLRREDIAVTQATVSRDIKELMLVKAPMPTGGGRSRYAFPPVESGPRKESRLEGLFADAVTGVDASANLVVLRTLPGMANAVASALDAAQWPEILGTVAGDDTIFAAVKPETAADAVVRRMKGMLGRNA